MDRKSSRTSILKPRKSINLSMENDVNLDTTTLKDAREARRVSFASSNFIKPFALDTDQITIWDNTYEEEVNHTDSTKSSENVETKVSELLDVTSAHLIKFDNLEDDEPRLEFLKYSKSVDIKVDEHDKENYIPILRQNNLIDMDLTFKETSMNFELKNDGMELTCVRSEMESKKVEKLEKMQFTVLDPEKSMQLTCIYADDDMSLENKDTVFNSEPQEMEFTCGALHSLPDKEAHFNEIQNMEFTCSGFPVAKILPIKTIENNSTSSDNQNMELTSCYSHDEIILAQRKQEQDFDESMAFTCILPNNKNILNESEHMKFTCSNFQTDKILVEEKEFSSENTQPNIEQINNSKPANQNLNMAQSKNIIFDDPNHNNMLHSTNNSPNEAKTISLMDLIKRKTQGNRSIMESQKIEECEPDDKSVPSESSEKKLSNNFCSKTEMDMEVKKPTRILSSKLIEPEADSVIKNQPLGVETQKNCIMEAMKSTDAQYSSQDRKIIHFSEESVNICKKKLKFTEPIEFTGLEKKSNLYKESKSTRTTKLEVNIESQPPSTRSERKTVISNETTYTIEDRKREKNNYCQDSLTDDDKSSDITKYVEKLRKTINFDENSTADHKSQTKESLESNNIPPNSLKPSQNFRHASADLKTAQNNHFVGDCYMTPTYNINPNISQSKLSDFTSNQSSEYKDFYYQPDRSAVNSFIKIPDLSNTPGTSFAMIVCDSHRVGGTGKPFNDNSKTSVSHSSECGESSEKVVEEKKKNLIVSTENAHCDIMDTSPIQFPSEESAENSKLFENSDNINDISVLSTCREEFYSEKISEDLMMMLKETDERIIYLLKNFTIPEIDIIDLVEMERLENEYGESSDSRLSEEGRSNNSDSNTGEDADIEIPKSLEERVREAAMRSEKYWQFAKCCEDVYFFYTLSGVVPFKVQLDPDSGVVYDVEAFTNLVEDPLPLVSYEAQFLHEKMKKDHLLHVLGNKFDVLTLLDYISLCMEDIINFCNEFIELQKEYGKSHRFRMNPDHSITIEVLNVEFIIWWIITGDMSLQKLGLFSSLRAHHKMKEAVDEVQIEKIMKSTQGPNYLRNFIKNLDEFVRKEGRSILARREEMILNNNKII